MQKCQQMVKKSVAKSHPEYGQSHQCGRHHYKDGWCKTHHPKLIAQREKEAAQWRAECLEEQENYRRARQERMLDELSLERALGMVMRAGYQVTETKTTILRQSKLPLDFYRNDVHVSPLPKRIYLAAGSSFQLDIAVVEIDGAATLENARLNWDAIARGLSGKAAIGVDKITDIRVGRLEGRLRFYDVYVEVATGRFWYDGIDSVSARLGR